LLTAARWRSSSRHAIAVDDATIMAHTDTDGEPGPSAWAALHHPGGRVRFEDPTIHRR